MNQPTPDPEYILRGVAGIVFGRQFHLIAPTTLGRSPECDICIPDPGISRIHARIRPLDYGIEIEDLKSTNGSFLNGQRTAVAVARVGDEIAFDQLRFRVDAVARPGRQAAARGRANHRVGGAAWPWIVGALVVASGIAAMLLR